MISIARGKYLRVSSMKMRQVCDAIRGKDVPTGLAMLAQINKGSSALVKKVLDSAVSNAKQKGLSENQLFIKAISANHGGLGNVSVQLHSAGPPRFCVGQRI